MESVRLQIGEGVQLTGATFANPVMAPWPLANIEGAIKSAYPPKTRNDACGFFRGYLEVNAGFATASAILVSFPTLPHLTHS